VPKNREQRGGGGGSRRRIKKEGGEGGGEERGEVGRGGGERGTGGGGKGVEEGGREAEGGKRRERERKGRWGGVGETIRRRRTEEEIPPVSGSALELENQRPPIYQELATFHFWTRKAREKW